MSSAEVGPLDGARTTNHDEPAIEPHGCSSKAEQSPASGHGTTTDDVTITKTTPDRVFGGGPAAAEKLTSDPVVIPSEQYKFYDKEVLICFLPSS